MMSHCDLHSVDIDRRGCPWCQLEEAQETSGRYYEDGRKMKAEIDHFREALHKIEDCDECDPEISISLLQLIAREALEFKP